MTADQVGGIQWNVVILTDSLTTLPRKGFGVFVPQTRPLTMSVVLGDKQIVE